MITSTNWIGLAIIGKATSTASGREARVCVTKQSQRGQGDRESIFGKRKSISPIYPTAL
jgi:hypothetical protein